MARIVAGERTMTWNVPGDGRVERGKYCWNVPAPKVFVGLANDCRIRLTHHSSPFTGWFPTWPGQLGVYRQHEPRDGDFGSDHTRRGGNDHPTPLATTVDADSNGLRTLGH